MLGMYDIPELAAANDRFWQAIRKELGAGPAELDRTRDYWDIWKDQGLVFAQTCGMPFRTALVGHVWLVGTPDYGLKDCAPGYYNSVIIARADATGETIADFSGQRFAFNEAVSQSGWAAPMVHAQTCGAEFGRFVQTGAHMASALAVKDGLADVAGIDALTWELISQYYPWSASLREVERTPPTPGLPYITSRRHDPAPVAKAVEKAIAGLSDMDRNLLHLKGLVQIPEQAYVSIATPPPPPDC